MALSLTRILLLLALCVGLLPVQAEARRAATKAETRGLQAGIRTYIATSGCCGEGADFRLVSTWISTVNRDFGIARLLAVTRDGTPGPRATVVLVHTRSGKWTPIAFGTARLACGVTPKIRRDLRLATCR